MKYRIALAAAAVAVLVAPAFAQGDVRCILAGRVSEGAWAPRFAAVQLLGANGQVISAASKEALATVRRARLTGPALLSRCDGDQPVASADDEPRARKSRVPALSRGVFAVESVNFPRLRSGGELVELRVRITPERVMLLTR
jgi:hypothetical protein